MTASLQSSKIGPTWAEVHAAAQEGKDGQKTGHDLGRDCEYHNYHGESGEFGHRRLGRGGWSAHSGPPMFKDAHIEEERI